MIKAVIVAALVLASAAMAALQLNVRGKVASVDAKFVVIDTKTATYFIKKEALDKGKLDSLKAGADVELSVPNDAIDHVVPKSS